MKLEKLKGFLLKCYQSSMVVIQVSFGDNEAPADVNKSLDGCSNPG